MSDAINFKTELECELAMAQEVAKAFQEAGRMAELRESMLRGLLREVWDRVRGVGHPSCCDCFSCAEMKACVEAALIGPDDECSLADWCRAYKIPVKKGEE